MGILKKHWWQKKKKKKIYIISNNNIHLRDFASLGKPLKLMDFFQDKKQ